MSEQQKQTMQKELEKFLSKYSYARYSAQYILANESLKMIIAISNCLGTPVPTHVNGYTLRAI